ncbi:MAG: Zinc ribbon domain [Miltoncostaeaceae bacterium]|jgi:putative FmdB family regulatory protein|nr:Zinc ribbon domain [Miltoncostaeaceae bacterium]
MPTYELLCPGCDRDFEVALQRFLRDADRICPTCGAGDAEIRITGFVTSRPARTSPEPRVTGFAGHGCCGGACGH